MRKSPIIVGPLVMLAALFALPVQAERRTDTGPLIDPAAASTRIWVQSGSAPGLVECVDRKSIVKRSDGYTQYDELSFCKVTDIAHGADPRPNLNDMIRVNRVRCDQDMTGTSVLTKSRPYSPAADGKYYWGEENATLANSLAGQTAKFVCQK